MDEDVLLRVISLSVEHGEPPFFELDFDLLETPIGLVVFGFVIEEVITIGGFRSFLKRPDGILRTLRDATGRP